MKLLVLFSLSVLPAFVVSMQPLGEQNIWSVQAQRHGWQECNYGWKPWNASPFHNIVPYSRAQGFLHGISKSYQTIRDGVYDDPAFFTQEYLEQTNKEHLYFFKHLVLKNFGWPAPQMFDSECLQGIFIIALHANNDEHFQLAALKYFDAHPVTDEVRQYCAYLSDRILVNRGQHQFYGTLFNEDGNLFPIQGLNAHETSSEKMEMQLQMVNERRAKQSLPPIARKYEIFSELLAPYKISICLAGSPS